MAIDKTVLRAQIADLISELPAPATFRGQTVTVMRALPSFAMSFLAAGTRDTAEFEVYMTDQNVAGQGDPVAGELITVGSDEFVITNVRPHAEGAFFTLNIRKR